ncbi:MAG: effector binding domain-containing protein [Candidatus Heimdallarchaeota archaeon]|nr:effector binding domain-containing protein [Candidatus Heimdallarchaeota archaeon]MCK4769644.1 effector binding domain-containing protein [Candidatus Heimdallarchaeota archaeon]
MGKMSFSSKEALKLFVLESLEEIANLHKALDHPTRLEILARLLVEDKEFKDLLEEMDIQKTTLANHLNMLVDYALVERENRGCYRISVDGEDLFQASAKVFLDMKVREQERQEALRMRYETLIKKYTVIGSEKEMAKDEFRIVKLPAMRVASFHAMGEFLGDPETKAGKKIYEWANPKGLYENKEKHRVFGFNNPDPKFDHDKGEFIVSKENPYGYEFWITIDEDFEVENEIAVKNIPEGLHVVKSCAGVHNLGDAWKELYKWIKNNDKYEFGNHQCLEQALNPMEQDGNKISFDLYFPIAGK